MSEARKSSAVVRKSEQWKLCSSLVTVPHELSVAFPPPFSSMSTYSGAFFFSENFFRKQKRQQTSAVVQRRFKLARNTRPHVNGKRAKHSAHDIIAGGSNNFTVFNLAAYASCIITNFTSAGPHLAPSNANSKAFRCPYLHYYSCNILIWPNFPGARVGQLTGRLQGGARAALYLVHDQTKHGYGIENLHCMTSRNV